MKTYIPLSLFLFLIISLSSCRGDDMLNNQEDSILDHPRIIDNIAWETYIDDDFEDLVEASNTHIYNLSHPVIKDNLIVYYNWFNNGFVALNRITGVEVWNNYGQILCPSIRNKPILHEDFLYFVCLQDVYKVDINSGTVNSFAWPNSDETIDDHIAIIDNRLYLQSHIVGGGVNNILWHSSDLDKFSPNSFSSFNISQNFMLDIPQSAKNADGHSLLIYSSKVGNFCLTAFNLTTDALEWEYCEEEYSSRNSNPIICDNNSILLFNNQQLFKFDLFTGQIIWNRSILPTDFSEVNDALINTNFGYFYVGWNGSILIDKKSGETLWHVEKYSLDESSEKVLRKGDDTPIAIGDKVYYFDAIQGYLITQDLANGDAEFNFINPSKKFGNTSFGRFGDFSNSEKVISEDNILYTSDYFTLLAFPLPD